jgi:hypothetical protein
MDEGRGVTVMLAIVFGGVAIGCGPKRRAIF